MYKRVQRGMNVYLKPPCKGCEMRDMNCHGSCKTYIQYKEDIEAMKKEKIEYRNKMSRRKY